jgi:hypothetical protein
VHSGCRTGRGHGSCTARRQRCCCRSPQLIKARMRPGRSRLLPLSRCISALARHHPRALSFTPQHTRCAQACRLNEAQCYLNLQEWHRVAACCTLVLDGLEEVAYSPASAAAATKALYRRARAVHELGETDAAIKDLRRAAALQPKSMEVRSPQNVHISSPAALLAPEHELRRHVHRPTDGPLVLHCAPAAPAGARTFTAVHDGTRRNLRT